MAKPGRARWRAQSATRAGSLVLLALALAACQDLVAQSGGEGRPALDKVERSARGSSMITVGDDRFMIPSGLDDHGCEMFRPYSANNPVKAAMHYRQADGGFGIVRDPAICRVEMTPIGADGEGCERYQAVPVNADLPPLDVAITYYQTADGGFSPRKPRESCA